MKMTPFGASPERPQANAGNTELLRQYYEVVQESFVLLHKLGYASDPQAVLAAMGIPRKLMTAEADSVAEAAPATQEVTAIAPPADSAETRLDEARAYVQREAA